MKPITATEFEGLTTAQRSQHFFLLDPNVITVRYVSQLMDGSPSNIRTKTGLALPAEIWEMIIQFMVSGTKQTLVSQTIPVVVDRLRGRPGRVLVRCIQVDLELGQRYDKSFYTTHFCEIRRFMANARRFGNRLPFFRITRRAATSKTFDIILDDFPGRFPCLFWDLSTRNFFSGFLSLPCYICHHNARGLEMCTACVQLYLEANPHSTVFPVAESCTYKLCALCMPPDAIARHAQWLDEVVKPWMRTRQPPNGPPTTEINDSTKAQALQNLKEAFEATYTWLLLLNNAEVLLRRVLWPQATHTNGWLHLDEVGDIWDR